MGAAAILRPVQEFFLLRERERTVAAYTPAQHRRVAELRVAADERLAASRRLPSPVAACLVLREAVVLLGRARAAARDASLDDEALARLDVADEVPPLPPDPFDGTAGAEQRVRDALRANDRLYVDRLEPGARERLRAALDAAARAMRGSVEARCRVHLRALRYGRLGAVLVALLYAAWLFAHRNAPVNVAVGKPVRVSSYMANPPDGHELVDGRPGFSYAVHTNVEDSPNVVVDLQGEYAIDHVAVYNRADGWWDDCLPLAVEISRDGRNFDPLGRRDEHVGFDKPWVVEGWGRVARYVRVRVLRRSYLTLRKLEVYGKKP
jgi:hypothetical protein